MYHAVSGVKLWPSPPMRNTAFLHPGQGALTGEAVSLHFLLTEEASIWDVGQRDPPSQQKDMCWDAWRVAQGDVCWT